MATPISKLGQRATTIGEREAKANVREVGGNNRGPRVSTYQKATWLSGTGWAWCMAFVVWCLYEAGARKFPRTAGVGWLYTHAKAQGWLVERPFRGDIALFDFHSGWPNDHTGFVVQVLSIRIAGCWYIKTVEGNTSGDSKGSQDDGGGVYIKRRLVRKSKVAFVRYRAEDEALGF